jgi:two-component sensor histidine kinase
VLDDYTQLSPMRAALRQTLDMQVRKPSREHDEIAEKMAVVATELATNALTHAGPPTVVRLSRTTTSFFLDVADDQPTKAPEIATSRLPGDGGLGLALTRQLALDAGWYTTDASKHVWAQFLIPRRRWMTHPPRISVPGLAALIQSLRRRRGNL